MTLEPAKLANTGPGLVSMVSIELQHQAKQLMKEQQGLFRQNQANYRNMTWACKTGVSALSKITPDEAKAYKQRVVNGGQKVADAAKEHGSAVADQIKRVRDLCSSGTQCLTRLFSNPMFNIYL